MAFGAERYQSNAGPRESNSTGKSFKIQSSIICRLEGGRIGEVRIYFDVLGPMAQLGLGPRSWSFLTETTVTRLTEKGRDLNEVLSAYRRWGEKWTPSIVHPLPFPKAK